MLDNPTWVRPRCRFLALAFLLSAAATYAQSQSLTSSAGPQHCFDPPGVHGMLVFGTQQVFASHLPMFHSPHHYQVLLALTLPDSAQAAYLGARHAFALETVYTLEPERLVLPEWVQHPRPFRATLYRGHFERGGVPIAHHVLVSVQRVIEFRQLDAAALPAPQQAFWLLGGLREQFLVHRIEGQPSFDQVLRVHVPAARTRRQLQRQDKRAWLRPGPNSRQPLTPGPVTGFSQQHLLPLTVEESVYLEFDDLR